MKEEKQLYRHLFTLPSTEEELRQDLVPVLEMCKKNPQEYLDLLEWLADHQELTFTQEELNKDVA